MRRVTFNEPVPPPVQQLQGFVSKDWSLPKNSVDEVYPGIFLSNAIVAKDVRILSQLGVTHIINAACGVDPVRYVDTSELFYMARNFKIKFLGIPAMDYATFQLNRYFNETSMFIDDALKTCDGKVLVHCLQGISRSATLVIAYLMIKKGMSVFDAVKTVRSKRNIYPNQGFLLQLYELDSYLQSKLQNHYSLR